MVPKLHAKGSSFKGAAAYLLHDKDGAATSGRVAWIETVNLATANPQAAWRVMAATAMDAPRLKEQAGVKRTGRTSKEPVLHLTLSWAPDQTPGPKEMAGFARRAIKALKADDRQAMIICHTDEKHPHVHVLLNRVSPADGRMLSSSNEKLALSALALAYEKECGAIKCKQRELNADKRKKGEHVRGEKDIPRPEFAAMQEVIKEAEKEISANILERNPQAAAELRATMKMRLRAKLDAIKEQLRPQWHALYQRQQNETEKAQKQKSSFVERMATWFGGRDKAGSPALPFQQVSLKNAGGDDRLRAQKQRAERAAIGRSYTSEVGKALGEIRTACQAAVRQMFTANDHRGGVAPAFGPAASGLAPAPAQTPAQKALSELAQKFIKEGRVTKPKEPSPARLRDKDKDREYEP